MNTLSTTAIFRDLSMCTFRWGRIGGSHSSNVQTAMKSCPDTGWLPNFNTMYVMVYNVSNLLLSKCNLYSCMLSFNYQARLNVIIYGRCACYFYQLTQHPLLKLQLLISKYHWGFKTSTLVSEQQSFSNKITTMLIAFPDCCNEKCSATTL